MLKKFKEWIGTGLDVYKVENANDIAPGLVRHIWKGEETATQIGTTLKAQIMNDLQKGLVHTLNTTRTTGMNKDIYEAVLGGIEEFGVLDGLKLLTRIDRENQYDGVFLRLGGVEYPIYKIKENTVKKLNKGDLKEKKEYLLNYNNNFFVLSDSVLYGTQPDTVLEGNRLAEIIGMEFGGNIQDTGNKTKGKFYYDNVTKFYYECIADTNLTYNDVTKFRAISNKPISDKVESLSKVEEYVFAINGLTNGKIVKIGKLAHLTIDSGTHFYNKGADAVVLNIPQGFRPRNAVNFSAVNLSNVPNSFRIATNGNVIKVFSDSKNGAYYFSVTYFTD